MALLSFGDINTLLEVRKGGSVFAVGRSFNGGLPSSLFQKGSKFHAISESGLVEWVSQKKSYWESFI